MPGLTREQVERIRDQIDDIDDEIQLQAALLLLGLENDVRPSRPPNLPSRYETPGLTELTKGEKTSIRDRIKQESGRRIGLSRKPSRR